uniref:C2H2-type domain-containing protein n=3 Tax=Lygus hesperus TaxID=30085 RepID=A0A146M6E1_LYGHE
MLLKPRYAPIKMTRRHNHSPEEVDNTIFYYNLKQRAKDEKDKSLRMIYDEEATRNPESATTLPFTKAKQAMQRARRRSYEDKNSSLDEGIGSGVCGLLDQSPMSACQRSLVSVDRQLGTSDSPPVSHRVQPASDLPPVSNKGVSGSDDDVLDVTEEPVSNKRPSAKVNLVSTRLAAATADDLTTNVAVQQIFIGTGEKIAESKMFYECSYCKRLFDKEDPLDQHMLDEHVNSLIDDDESWPANPENI